jgi:hypothetical protein
MIIVVPICLKDADGARTRSDQLLHSERGDGSKSLHSDSGNGSIYFDLEPLPLSFLSSVKHEGFSLFMNLKLNES